MQAPRTTFQITFNPIDGSESFTASRTLEGFHFPSTGTVVSIADLECEVEQVRLNLVDNEVVVLLGKAPEIPDPWADSRDQLKNAGWTVVIADE